MVDDDDTGPTKSNVTSRSLLAHLREYLKEYANPGDPHEMVLAEDGSRLVVDDVDVEVWAAWTLVGLRSFSGELPTSRALAADSQKILLIAAKERFAGNISRMAEALGTSRRIVRDRLKAHGFYSPPGSSSEPPIGGDE